MTWHITVQFRQKMFFWSLEYWIVFHIMRNSLKVHWAMSQVVFPPNVGDLLGLHGLQLRTECNTMTETTAKCTAPFPCENTRIKYVRKRKIESELRWWDYMRGTIKRNQKVITQQTICEKHVGLEKKIRVRFALKDSPPISNMVSSPVWSTWRTGGTFCLASISRAFRSINTDSSERGNVQPPLP